MREVVAASNQACGCGAVVVRGETRIDVGGAFGRFDDYEAGAGTVGAFEVYAGLVVRDVEALDCGAFLKGGGEGEGEEEEAGEGVGEMHYDRD